MLVGGPRIKFDCKLVIKQYSENFLVLLVINYYLFVGYAIWELDDDCRVSFSCRFLASFLDRCVLGSLYTIGPMHEIWDRRHGNEPRACQSEGKYCPSGYVHMAAVVMGPSTSGFKMCLSQRHDSCQWSSWFRDFSCGWVLLDQKRPILSTQHDVQAESWGHHFGLIAHFLDCVLVAIFYQTRSCASLSRQYVWTTFPDEVHPFNLLWFYIPKM